MTFHSNLALLSATFLNFKADNKFVLKSFFIYISVFSRLIIEHFVDFLDCDFIFFSLRKRRFVRFLARMGHDYRVLFWLFWYIISVILSIFPLFWHFLDAITLKSRLMVGNRDSRHLLLLVIHWQYSGSNTRKDIFNNSN